MLGDYLRLEKLINQKTFRLLDHVPVEYTLILVILNNVVVHRNLNLLQIHSKTFP